MTNYERKGEVKDLIYALLTKPDVETYFVKMKSFPLLLALSLVSVDAAVQVQNNAFPIRSYLACDSAELVANLLVRLNSLAL